MKGVRIMESPNVTMKSAVPILRIFDEQKAKEFYIDFLGFSIDWEHRFEDHFPLYMQIFYSGCILHLSEHHGDCCPGSAIRIEVDQIRTLHANLLEKNYKYARPGLEQTPWQTEEISVQDPFGNRIIFSQSII